jgi:hypothetical protein
LENLKTGGNMKLMDILTLPSFYKDRLPKVNAVSISNFSINTDNIINCSCITNNKHITKISFTEIVDITPQSLCVCDCNCDSFKFEFAYVLNKNNGLLYPENYPNLSAKKKNTYSHLCGCKHTIKFAQYIYHKSNILNNTILKEIEKNVTK